MRDVIKTLDYGVIHEPEHQSPRQRHRDNPGSGSLRHPRQREADERARQDHDEHKKIRLWGQRDARLRVGRTMDDGNDQVGENDTISQVRRPALLFIPRRRARCAKRDTGTEPWSGEGSQSR